MSESQELVENPQMVLENYSSLQHELETAYQTLHDCKRQLKMAETLEKEYQYEIESLNVELGTKEKTYASKICQIEEDFANTKFSLIERIQGLENELINKDAKIEQLQNALEIAKKCELSTEGPDEEKMLADLAKQKDEIDFLTEAIHKMEASMQEFQNLNNTQQIKVNVLEAECERLNEALNLKKEELNETKELNQTLQDEIMCVKTELEALKSKPLEEKSKGNSLFSEVDDRRVELQSTVNSMKARYNEVKRERAEHLKLIEHLRNENAVLCKRWEAEIQEKYTDGEVMEESLRARIKTLEDLLEKYQKDLNEKSIQLSGSSCDEMQFFDGLLDGKRKEIEELREKIAGLSLSQTLLTKELAETKKESRKCKLQVLQQENEITKLKADLQQANFEKKCEHFEKFANKIPNNSGDNRQSNITTRKKSSTSAQFSLKSCLKSKSIISNGEQIENAETAEVPSSLKSELSPSYSTEKDVNQTKDENKEVIDDKEDCVIVNCEPRKVQFTQDAMNKTQKTKPRPPAKKIITSSNVTYIDKPPVRANKVVSIKENLANDKNL